MKPNSLSLPRLGLSSDGCGRYRRQVDPDSGADPPAGPTPTPRDRRFTAPRAARPSYGPLEEDVSQQKSREEKKVKKKAKYKKYKKNVGKALRYSWKCLMLGLQNFTVGYSAPITAAASIIPDLHPGGAWG